VNIENATSIFWVEQEKASIIGFPSGADSIKVIEKPEIIIRGHDVPRVLKARSAPPCQRHGDHAAKMKFKEDCPFATPERKLLELANAIEVDHADRLSVAVINKQFRDAGGCYEEYGAAVKGRHRARLGHAAPVGRSSIVHTSRRGPVHREPQGTLGRL
jgi:hypothetical protein